MLRPVPLALPEGTYDKLRAIAAAEYRRPRDQAAIILIEALDGETESWPVAPLDDRDQREVGRLVVHLAPPAAEALRVAAAANHRTPREHAAKVLHDALVAVAKPSLAKARVAKP